MNREEYINKHGQRFVSHFRLKKVNSPFLKNLAIIDTPGMLDSITERDRGYNYQEVIGDLAQITDVFLNRGSTLNKKYPKTRRAE
jgi:EH domain-containing protein 1